jgi:hypothetical protein
MMMIEFYLCYVLILVFEQFYICAYFLSIIKHLWFINTMFTLCHCVTKRGEYFVLLLVFRPEMYFQSGQVFLSQNGQMGSLLVFLLATFWVKQKHFM